MKVSERYGQLVRDAMGGLTYSEVERATSISATYLRRMKNGIVPTAKTTVKFCSGLGIPEEEFLHETSKARPLENPEGLLHAAARLSGFSPPDRLELLRYFRQFKDER